MLFSVIVPIYKVELYLPTCVDSILNQSFGDFEVILVDDGSPDSCGRICDEYAEKDERVRVIHKENGGLVSARKAGIEAAQGEYVFHVDSDDALLPGALEKAAAIIAETGADVVSFSYRIRRGDLISEPVLDQIEPGLYDEKGIEEKVLPHLICDENLHHLFYYLWGRAIRTQLTRSWQLAVPDRIRLGEDIPCLAPTMLHAKTVYFSRECSYLYTIREDSLSTDFKTAQLTQIEGVIRHFLDLDCVRQQAREQIYRYAAYMALAIFAAAAEGGYRNALPELKRLFTTLGYSQWVEKARFGRISPKSAVTVFLMKHNCLSLAFSFLQLCGWAKKVLKK